jgi:hypothetical protein
MTQQPFKKGDRVRFRSGLVLFIQLMPSMTVRAITPDDDCASGWLVVVRVGWFLSGVYFRGYDSGWFERVPKTSTGTVQGATKQ